MKSIFLSLAFTFSFQLFAARECDEPVWVVTPQVVGGVFTGTIASYCTFDPIKGGTVQDLKDGLLARVKDEVDQVHAGPLAAEYDELPATYFDVTEKRIEDGCNLEIRSDLFLASNSYSFIQAAISKEIHGEGMAANLKTIEALYAVGPSAQVGRWNLRVESSMEIKKPGALPAGVFKAEIMKRTENKIKETREKLILRVNEYL